MGRKKRKKEGVKRDPKETTKRNHQTRIFSNSQIQIHSISISTAALVSPTNFLFTKEKKTQNEKLPLSLRLCVLVLSCGMKIRAIKSYKSSSPCLLQSFRFDPSAYVNAFACIVSARDSTGSSPSVENLNRVRKWQPVRVAQRACAEWQRPLAHRVHFMQLGRRRHRHLVGHRGGWEALTAGRRAVVHRAEDVLPEGGCWPGIILAWCGALLVWGGCREGVLARVVEDRDVVRADHLCADWGAKHGLRE